MNLKKVNILLSNKVQFTQFIPLPSEITVGPEEYLELENKIISIFGNSKKNYSFYIKDLNTDIELSYQADKNFPPASIYKVPLAMIILKDVDNGVMTLEDEYQVTSAEKIYSFDRLSQKSGNYYISLKELLYYLIHYSDNTAMTTLEHRFGGVELLQKRIKDELGFSNITRIPLSSNSKSIGAIFESLYKQNLLSHDSNEFLLDLLKNVTPEHNDRICAGLPEGIECAHKIGNLDYTYEDAGIVYGDTRSYIIVVLNDNIDPSVARNKIKEISKITYEYLNI